MPFFFCFATGKKKASKQQKKQASNKKASKVWKKKQEITSNASFHRKAAHYAGLYHFYVLIKYNKYICSSFYIVFSRHVYSTWFI